MSSSSSPGESLSSGQRIATILILGALTALGPFTIDLYLPALPDIEQDVHASTEAVQLTLTGTTLGFALGMLIVGPVSDRFGRKVPLLCSTAVHIIASLGSTIANDIVLLNFLRFFQGFGAAAGSVVAMAMVRDLFSGKPLVTMLSRLALVNGVAPIAAPVIGSQLLLVTDWHGIFGFLGVYGLVILILTWLLIRETLPPERRQRSIDRVLAGYRAVLSDRIYLGALIVGGLNFSGLFAYLSASSFLFQNTYQLNAQQFGILFGGISIGTVAGVQIASRLANRFGSQWVLLWVTAAKVVCSAVTVGFALSGTGLWGVVVPLWLVITLTGMTFPLVQVLALARHGQHAGTASSLFGASNFGVGGLITPLVGVLGVSTAVPMAGVMFAGAVLALLVVVLVIRPATVPEL